MILLGSLAATLTAAAQPTEISIRDAYPNGTLTGWNHETDALSMLWFTEGRGGRFQQHNTLPGDDCHADHLRWRKGTLRYKKTVNDCGDQRTVIRYTPAIRYAPATVDSDGWDTSGQSAAVYKVDGQVMCTGTNTWSARSWITPAGNARFTSNQSTVWDTGDCADTEWRETYVISDGELVRSFGGNGTTFVWDVRYEPAVN